MITAAIIGLCLGIGLIAACYPVACSVAKLAEAERNELVRDDFAHGGIIDIPSIHSNSISNGGQ